MPSCDLLVFGKPVNKTHLVSCPSNLSRTIHSNKIKIAARQKEKSLKAELYSRHMQNSVRADGKIGHSVPLRVGFMIQRVISTLLPI